MARVNHQMGIISLFIVLVVVIASSSFLIRFISKSMTMSGFEDAPAMVSNGPSCVVSGNQGQASTVPDQNMETMCNTTADGETCPEGTFCYGVTQKCVPISVAMYSDDVQGYYT
jgi:hypothetical protein